MSAVDPPHIHSSVLEDSSDALERAPSPKLSPKEDKPLVQRLRTALTGAGYRIDYDPDYEQRYKLNLIVTRVKDIHAHVNLGILATLTNDDLNLQEQFLEGSRRGVVHKSIYIEIDSRTLDTGAIPVAISACMSFLFDRRYSSYKCVGLRIFEDCTFHLFDIDENVRRLRRDSSEESAEVGQDMGHRLCLSAVRRGGTSRM